MEFMARKSRSMNEGEFTAEELEVADILISMSCFGEAPILEWGAKRKRSRGIARGGPMNCNNNRHHSKPPPNRSKFSPVSPLGVSSSEAEDYYGGMDSHYNGGMDDLPQQLPPPAASCPKSAKVRDPTTRRTPKKKTHRELKETLDALSVERDRLKEDKGQLLKTYQKLQDRNKRLKSELQLQLARRQEQQSTSIMWATLDNPHLGHETGTSAWFDELSRFQKHGCSKDIADASTSAEACNKPHGNEWLTYQYSSQFSSGFERVHSKHAKDVSSVGIPDLNGPSEAWPHTIMGSHSDHMFLSIKKAVFATESRKRRIELRKDKYCKSLKA